MGELTQNEEKLTPNFAPGGSLAARKIENEDDI
jgi:hypothetical protein